jgi:hypothetical protein
MRHSSKLGRGPKGQRRGRFYRPQCESLEQRLPPGDMLLGTALGLSWAVRDHSLPGTDS